jgi:hypothetical protein
MKVTITGSGFRQGDEAVWEGDGHADDRVVVENTEFVSESQLIATISVQADAPGYQVIRLGGLFQTAASYRAAGASDVVSTGRSRCRARPGRSDRCR